MEVVNHVLQNVYQEKLKRIRMVIWKKKSEYILTCISYVKKNNTIIKIE